MQRLHRHTAITSVWQMLRTDWVWVHLSDLSPDQKAIVQGVQLFTLRKLVRSTHLGCIVQSSELSQPRKPVHCFIACVSHTWSSMRLIAVPGVKEDVLMRMQ